MKILWVATKAPWPPVDGGRLLLLNTLRALSAAGHELTLVAPVAADSGSARIEAALQPYCHPSLVPVQPRPVGVDIVRSQLTRSPLTIVRHTQPAVGKRVADHQRQEVFDLVQVEQIQALSSIPARLASPPVILRAQNVESDLWAQSAQRSSGWRPLLGLETKRLAAWEGRCVERCDATVALTAEDTERLQSLAGTAGKVHHVPAPFETNLPTAPDPLPGSPPIVLFGSGGWQPNAAGAGWFLKDIWPRVRSARPDAILHLFGLEAADSGLVSHGVVSHPPPADSRDAYPRGSVLVVPLEIASGVRIKILEAWARGVPVVATPQAARGLEADDGEHLLLARDGAEFAAALRQLGDEKVAARLIANGRRHLRRQHDFSQVAQRLTTLYENIVR